MPSSVGDSASAVARFGGEQRFVVDYLSTEVLAALDDPDTAKDLSAILAARPDRRWHAAALAGLAAIGDAAARKQLLEILSSDRHALVADAAEAAGLAAGTDHHYRFRLGDRLSPAGRTRTLPAGSPELREATSNRILPSRRVSSSLTSTHSPPV